jgi:hypothetical protein
MLSLFIAAIIVTLGLLVLIWVGTLCGQGYIYDSPAEGLHWRAPAAAGALGLFFLLWMLAEYAYPNSTDTIFRFSTEHADDYDHFISVRKNEEGKEEEIRFDRHSLGSGRFEFRDDQGNSWSRSSSGMMVALILEEKDPAGGDKPVRHRFDAELTKDGKFAPSHAGGVTQKLRYHEQDGKRFIIEDELGKVFDYQSGLFYLNLLVNGLHLLVWFLVLWLLLQFQWSHALGFAVICWFAITLGILPEMLGRARDARKRAEAQKPIPAVVTPSVK